MFDPVPALRAGAEVTGDATDMTMGTEHRTRAIDEIASYHAHIYFEPATRGDAADLREAMEARFAVRMGRWHDRLIGPHSRAMYQVAFDCGLFASFVPWLMLNHRGLSVLVHPNTLNPRRDHLEDALWIGPRLPVFGEVLATEVVQADGVGEINTQPLPSMPI